MSTHEKSSVFRFIPLVIIIILVIGFFYFHLFDYLSTTSVQTHYHLMQLWTQQHYFFAVIIYCLLYTSLVAMGIPGASSLTIAGGFLFGALGFIYAVISITLGASILFFAVKLPLKHTFAMPPSTRTSRLKKNFKANAFYYLLFLNLVPVFPFWLINILSATSNVPFKTYFKATFLGALPLSAVQIWLGIGLQTILQTQGKFEAKMVLTPQLFLPLLVLGILSLLPIFYKGIKGV